MHPYCRLSRWLSGRESACQYRRCAFDLWVGKITWRRKWQLTPVCLPGKSHGQRSLVGYSHKRVEHSLATKPPQWQSLFQCLFLGNSKHISWIRNCPRKQILRILELPWWLSSEESTCQCKRQFPSLVQEKSTCHRATKPVCHNYWACALEPGSRNHHSLKALKPELRNKRCRRNEKPMHRH